jgi:hypothetical protein
LKSGPKRFWFKIAVDEDIISCCLKIEPLLLSVQFISNNLNYEPLLIYDPAAFQDELVLIERII